MLTEKQVTERAKEGMRVTKLNFHAAWCLEAAIDFENKGCSWEAETMLKHAIFQDERKKV